jgi:apolipoprotein N-acyltransferase
VDEVALILAFLHVFRFSSVSIIPIMLFTLFMYLLLLSGRNDKWVEPGDLRAGIYFQFSFFFVNVWSDVIYS